MLSQLVLCAALVVTATAKACSPGPADVMFVLSSNSTLSLTQFQQKLEIIEHFVKGANIGPDGVRVGVVAEYGYADLEFSLEKHLDKPELLNALSFIYYGQVGATQGVGLEYLNQAGINTFLGGRPNVQDVVIFLTTSDPSGSYLAHLESLKLQQTGAIVIGLGLGEMPKLDLLSVASGCHYIAQVDGFSLEPTLIEAALNLTCDAVNGVPADDCCYLPTCCPLDLDVMFLLDASTVTGQTKQDFEKQLEWAKDIAAGLEIASNASRIGAVTYADHAHPQFGFNTHLDKAELLMALEFLPMQFGGRHVETGLQWIAAHNGPARPGAQKVVVVTSTGPQQSPSLASSEVARLKAMGVQVVSVGIGNTVQSHLESIASTPGKVVHYDTFEDLLKDNITGKVLACGGEVSPETSAPTTPAPTTPAPTTPAPTTPRPTTPRPATAAPVTAAPTSAANKCADKHCQHEGGCIESEGHATCICPPRYSGDLCQEVCTPTPSDVIFMLDSSRSEGAIDYRKQVDFVGDVVQSLTIGQNDVQVGLMSFSTRNFLSFNLDDHHSVASLLNAVHATQYNKGFTNTGGALKYVREDMMQPSSGLRLNAQTIVIVLTDGQSTDSTETVVQSQLLKDTGALVIAIGIGQSTNDAELTTIASNDQHKFSLTNFDLLTTIQQDIVRTTQTCTVAGLTKAPVATPAPTTPAPTTPAPTTPTPTIAVPDNSICAANPCLNSGTCTPDGEGFKCQCTPGHSGTFCLHRS